MSGPTVPGEIQPMQAEICRRAISYLGIREDRGRPNRSAAVDHFQPKWIADDPNRAGVPWCASFVTVVWSEAFRWHPLGSIERSADAIQDRSIKLGMWHASPTALPCPGDAFVLIHGVDRPKHHDPGHTGIVLASGFDEHGALWVETIEGNVRNGCRHGRRRVVTDREPKPEEILGFARPVAGALRGDPRTVLGGEVFGAGIATR